MKETGPGGWKARALLAAALTALAAAGLLLATTRIEVEGRWRGLFLLKAREGHMLELQDDLYLGDGSRLLAGVSFAGLRRWMGAEAPPPAKGEAALALEWDERSGRGIVRNHLGDGRELVTLLGRYEDDAGKHPRGLFVGGAVPEVAGDLGRQNQSGMALQQAGEWFHIWCNTNEALVDMAGGAYRNVTPGDLEFLGSRVLVNDARRVVLQSSHLASMAGGKLRMERFAYFAAGEPFFRLGIQLTNLGPGPVTYAYLYGDEPWVGHFGTASGNYGWIEGEIVTTEARVRTGEHRWAGIIDLKTGHANYLEWLEGDQPDDAYFANRAGHFAEADRKVPLDSNEIFIGLQWVGRRLAPGESRAMRLAIGMAGRNPVTGRPQRPPSADEP